MTNWMADCVVSNGREVTQRSFAFAQDDMGASVFEPCLRELFPRKVHTANTRIHIEVDEGAF